MTILDSDQSAKLRELQRANKGIKKNGAGWLLMVYTAMLACIPATCATLHDKYSELIQQEQALYPDIHIVQ